MSRKDVEEIQEKIVVWERRLERAVETGQRGMRAMAEQKIQLYYQMLREAVL